MTLSPHTTQHPDLNAPLPHMMGADDAIILAGPTASGKSAYALSIAQKFSGVIINADAMQCYAALPILTAQPDAQDKAQAPHMLYSILPAHAQADVAHWLTLAVDGIYSAQQAGKLPIIVGGTGMYIRALMQGIAPIPDITDDARHWARTTELDILYDWLHQHDALGAAKFKPTDSQRIRRACEVLRSSGTPLRVWQARPTTPPLPHIRWHLRTLLPERSVLYSRINARVDQMLHHGALEELQAFLATNPPNSAALHKAVGVPEFSAYLHGKTTLQEATSKTQQHTRNYAKRQMTWLRGQMGI